MDFRYYKDTSILFVPSIKKDNLLLYIQHNDNYTVDYIKPDDIDWIDIEKDNHVE